MQLLKRSIVSIILRNIKSLIFKYIHNQHLDVYFSNRDAMAPRIILNGEYEPEVNALLSALSPTNGDFFLDIGANIGLTTVQNANLFQRIHCFEPNAEVFSILNANLRLNGIANAICHQFGIGMTNETVELYVPARNAGGAFILHENTYSRETLAHKDNWSEWKAENYTRSQVALRKGREVFTEIFQELSKQDLTRGIIKIDVEGYEPIIISELLASVSENIDFVVVFENWAPSMKLDYPEEYRGQTYHSKISRNLDSSKGIFKLMKALTSGETFYLSGYRDGDVGTILVSNRDLSNLAIWNDR